MRVRRATARDFAAVQFVHERAVEPRDAFSCSSLRQALGARRIRLALIDGQCAGLCVLARNGYINAVAVLPGFRRRGVGAALLRAAIRAGAKRAEIRAGNTASEAMFLRAGFRVTGLRANRYADGEAALVMAR